MEEIGKVVSTKGKNAVVEFERKTACSKCGMCAFKKDEMFVKCTMYNRCDARIGDIVRVHMGKNFVLTAALIAYMIPLVLTGIAVACTFMLADYIQFIAVMVALVLGFTIAALLDKFVIRKKKGFRPTMVGIINKPMTKENIAKVNEEIENVEDIDSDIDDIILDEGVADSDNIDDENIKNKNMTEDNDNE